MHLVPTLVVGLVTLFAQCSGQSHLRIFSDTQMFSDISMYNFFMGNSFEYVYILGARPGRQVNLYLFQNDYQQYSIEVRDGSQYYDKIIPVKSSIPSNDKLLTLPIPIVSTGQNMRVKISADKTNATGVMDFQALFTDFVQPDSCSNLVLSVNQRDSYVQGYRLPVDKVQDCYYVIHANDHTNNPSLIQSVKASHNDYIIYKGLQTDADHVLQHDELMSGVWASDKYLVVKPNAPIYMNFGSTILKNLDQTTNVAPKTHGSIMTNDYYQNNYPDIPGPLNQTFTLVKDASSASIQVSYVKLMGAGSLTVTAFTGNKQVGKPTTYFASKFNGGVTLTYNCDKLVLQYSTPSRPKDGISGFYGLYADGTTPFKQ